MFAFFRSSNGCEREIQQVYNAPLFARAPLTRKGKQITNLHDAIAEDSDLTLDEAEQYVSTAIKYIDDIPEAERHEEKTQLTVLVLLHFILTIFDNVCISSHLGNPYCLFNVPSSKDGNPTSKCVYLYELMQWNSWYTGYELQGLFDDLIKASPAPHSLFGDYWGKTNRALTLSSRIGRATHPCVNKFFLPDNELELQYNFRPDMLAHYQSATTLLSQINSQLERNLVTLDKWEKRLPPLPVGVKPNRPLKRPLPQVCNAAKKAR